MSSRENTSVKGGENTSGKSGESTPLKEMMQQFATKFEEAWDIDKNPKLEDQWDITKNPTYQDKWAVNRNSATGQKKNAVLKDILHDVAAKIVDKWDAYDHSTKSEEEKTGDEASAKSGKGDSHKTHHKSSNKDEAAGKRETGSVEASSEARAGSFSGDNPYIQSPVSVSRSGLEQ